MIDRNLIAKAKEKIGDKTAEMIAEIYDVEIDRNGKGLCPFHDENTPSFIYNSKNNTFHCFGCGVTVDIIDAFMSKEKTYIEAVQCLFETANIKHSFGEVGVKKNKSYRYPNQEEINDKKAVIKYLNLRGISKKTIDYADIREDTRGNIVFNYYDTNDVLTMVKYRPSRKVNKGESKNWAQKDKDTTPLLFNMNRVNPESPLLICEGEIDCLAAIESGYKNAVSVPFGANSYEWIEHNWEWLEQFDSIIVCADNDRAGQEMIKEVTYRLGSWRVKIVQLPESCMCESGEKQIKDINELMYYCGSDKVLECIINAKESPIDSVMDFSEIKDKNLSDIDGIRTGIKGLDSKIMRLFYGNCNILTGIAGAGKTTFLTQICAQSLDQGKDVFLYSAELPNYQTKNWINFILAGQRNITKKTSGNSVYYKVNEDAKRKMDEYYRGRLFIYKEDFPRTTEDILKSMEECVRKFGVKLLIIDNLTAVNFQASNKDIYQKQEAFINQLVSFSQKYNVAIVTVVHPHKMDTTRRMTSMDIQGSSSILNLTHRVFALYRVSESEKRGVQNYKGDGYKVPPIKHDVIIDVLKDRMTGKNFALGLYYDYPSRRFFETEKDLDHRYLWDKTEYVDGLPYPPQQLYEEDEVFGKRSETG